KIDEGARQLLDKARVSGWHALRIPAQERQPAYTVFFDGTGRYTYERTLFPGLRERVICDGKTLLHLYPDLGLGARRTVSRFHRAAFSGLVPWAIPRAEDLARGADLRLADERTVCLIPHGLAVKKGTNGKASPYRMIRFLFTANGNLAERHVVLMPGKKILYR